ncbi:hypothetical protein [Peptoniphilus hominis (ex Hitch et al. 2025)]|uniref:Uncharacterized protein n=1 Tax=Peptoniphilus hominis (ex Hitch et al. 2025) TaxID=3133174 RepID=A0ABV1CDE2_9FIRM
MSTRKKKKGKGQYSKALVTMIICLNIVFTIAVFFVFARTGSEPSTLIATWFSFTTVELWSLARIKKKKIDREINEIKYGGSDYDSQ